MEGEISADEASQVEARKSSNLAFAFFCMSKDRARDMEVFYSYCRILDDIADDANATSEQKIASLNFWKGEIEKIYSGRTSELSKMSSQIRDTVMRRDIPKQYMLDIIDGVMRDTDPAPFETYADIKKYCYGVASAVGLVSIYIFGFKSEKTKLFAESLGYALQFTNILRDAVYDFKQMGRCYIPRVELERFGAKPEDFGADSLSRNCRDLLRMLYFRAKHFFNRSRRLLQPEDARALTPAFIMWDIYEHILEEIARRDFMVSEDVVKVSKPKKIALAFSAIRRAKKYAKSAPKNFGRAAVLGAGLSGIAAAVNLSLKGYEVDLFEAKSRVGGRAGAMDLKSEGLHLDNGSHVVMNCYDSFLNLLKILGTADTSFYPPAEKIVFVKPGGESFSYDFCASGGGFPSLLGNIFKFPKIEGFSVGKNLSMLFKIKMGMAEAFEGETVNEYLARQGVGDVSKRLLWEPFCVSVQNTDCEEASAMMFVESIKKSLLRGAGMSSLLINKIPFADTFWPRAKYYLEACGGSVNLASAVTKINVEGARVASFEAGGKVFDSYDYVVFALPRKMLSSLLESESGLKKAADSIADSPILNVYFTTKKRLFEEPFAALAESPLHWIFDRTESSKIGGGRRLYSIVVSAFSGDFNPQNLREKVLGELKKYFGDFEIETFVPSLFKDATMLSTCKGESARPASFGHFENAAVVGDWVDTGLPCTMESAARSAELRQL